MVVLRLPREEEEQEFLHAYRAASIDTPTFAPYYETGMPFRRYLDLLTEREQGINPPSADHVPATILFAFVESAIVGRASVRHALSPPLEKEGGHIGYVVVPEFRRRGYATSILARSLEIARDRFGIRRALVTCDDGNVGSIRTIEKNGGILQDVVPMGTKSIRRYWIATSSE